MCLYRPNARWEGEFEWLKTLQGPQLRISENSWVSVSENLFFSLSDSTYITTCFFGRVSRKIILAHPKTNSSIFSYQTRLELASMVRWNKKKWQVTDSVKKSYKSYNGPYLDLPTGQLSKHKLQKQHKIAGLNDYRPVALTSVVMKSFERLVLAYLKASNGPLLEPLQFAYRANMSVDDAVKMGLHFILQHLDRPETYVRILFRTSAPLLTPSSRTPFRINWHSPPSPPPSVSGSPASWQTGNS